MDSSFVGPHGGVAHVRGTSLNAAYWARDSPHRLHQDVCHRLLYPCQKSRRFGYLFAAGIPEHFLFFGLPIKCAESLPFDRWIAALFILKAVLLLPKALDCLLAWRSTQMIASRFALLLSDEQSGRRSMFCVEFSAGGCTPCFLVSVYPLSVQDGL
jgi:hypothetical protein